MKDIVDASGLSKQTFYNHFQDKQDLIKYVWLSHFDDPAVEFQDYPAFADKAARLVADEWWLYRDLMRDNDSWGWMENWLAGAIIGYIERVYGSQSVTRELKAVVASWTTGCTEAFRRDIMRGSISGPEDVYFARSMAVENLPALIKRYLIPDR